MARVKLKMIEIPMKKKLESFSSDLKEFIKIREERWKKERREYKRKKEDERQK